LTASQQVDPQIGLDASDQMVDRSIDDLGSLDIVGGSIKLLHVTLQFEHVALQAVDGRLQTFMSLLSNMGSVEIGNLILRVSRHACVLGWLLWTQFVFGTRSWATYSPMQCRDFGSSVGTAPAAAGFAGAAVSLQSSPLKSAFQAVQIAAQLPG
jgi:ABC-type glucose/galactose transport system permease subunit